MTTFKETPLSLARKLHMARVSGAYFPANVSADEIRLSLEIGTRIRCR